MNNNTNKIIIGFLLILVVLGLVAVISLQPHSRQVCPNCEERNPESWGACCICGQIVCNHCGYTPKETEDGRWYCWGCLFDINVA